MLNDILFILYCLYPIEITGDLFLFDFIFNHLKL